MLKTGKCVTENAADAANLFEVPAQRTDEWLFTHERW
jgi:hypothetical protein